MTSRRSVLKMLGAAMALPVISRFVPASTPPTPPTAPPVTAAPPSGQPRVVVVAITGASHRPGVYRGIIRGGDNACYIINLAEGDAGHDLTRLDSPVSRTHVGYPLDRDATDGKPVVAIYAS